MEFKGRDCLLWGDILSDGVSKEVAFGPEESGCGFSISEPIDLDMGSPDSDIMGREGMIFDPLGDGVFLALRDEGMILGIDFRGVVIEVIGILIIPECVNEDNEEYEGIDEGNFFFTGVLEVSV